ncbi:MarR family transcriptional regulator [Amycolatopsis coloradensis]|uniref:MarR family transcriptional regulator n=1 Tax=Amycolatopsis coloradensis TaxID=76021 RepID=UPI001FC98C0C|nr:MarR family transcriptional regulator [Amycolatopsis coloradensis]
MAKYPLSAEEMARFAHPGREGGTLTVLRHARIAERRGLSATDHDVLELIGQTPGPLTPGRIAELTGLPTGAVTAVMDRLEKVVPGAMDRHAPLFESASRSPPRRSGKCSSVSGARYSMAFARYGNSSRP